MLTPLWKRRIAKLQESGNGFTYNDMSDILGLSRTNIANKIVVILEDDPQSITEGEKDGSKAFFFDYDTLLQGDNGKEVVPDIPEWLVRDTYENVTAEMDALIDDDEVLTFEKYGTFEPRFQRGGLLIKVFEEGQKRHDRQYVARTDNCVVLSVAPNA